MTGSSCVTANEVATNTNTGEQISHHGAAADTVVILDFETTGLSPGEGDRGIEIGAVKIECGQVIGRFQELMYPGQRISGFIESHTGISNEMLAKARPCGEVMRDFSEFIQGFNLVAHDRRCKDIRYPASDLRAHATTRWQIWWQTSLRNVAHIRTSAIASLVVFQHLVRSSSSAVNSLRLSA